jgi:stage II sporulation protein D
MRMSKVRRRASFLAISLLAPLLMTPAFGSTAPALFSFTGSGFGHGVGMSQIGARALAAAGESATSILKYYYKDVDVIPVIDTATIRVNIGNALRGAIFSTSTSGSSLRVYAGDLPASETTTAPIMSVANKKKLTISISLDKKGIQGLPGTPAVATLRWSGGTAPVVTVTESNSISRYRYGQIQIKVIKGALEITNSLALRDEYLLGISEVPSSWPPAILEAQTIAARSYALSKMGTIRPACDCNVYDHIVDQNFVGFSKESEARFGQIWRAAVLRTLVDTSTGLAILSKGKPIQAYYFSSSGGATQSSADAWGGFTAYTHSVADTASVLSTLNPRYASWSATATQALVSRAFGLPDVASLEILSRNSAGAVTWIKGVSTNGVSMVIRGDTFRSRTKIPSPWFTPVAG